MNAFKKGIDVVISKTMIVSENGNEIKREIRTRSSYRLLEDFISLKVSWYLPDPMYRRKFLEEKILFNEYLYKGQDRDFHTRRLLENPNILFIKEYLTEYRQTAGSISQDFKMETVKSFYDSTNDLIDKLLARGISYNLKYYLLKKQLKSYPYLYMLKSVTFKNFNLFKILGRCDLRTLKWFFKYLVSMISYKVIGKGQQFLSGE